MINAHTVAMTTVHIAPVPLITARAVPLSPATVRTVPAAVPPPAVTYRPPKSRLVLAVLDEHAIARLRRLRYRRRNTGSWRSMLVPLPGRRFPVARRKARRSGRR